MTNFACNYNANMFQEVTRHSPRHRSAASTCRFAKKKSQKRPRRKNQIEPGCRIRFFFSFNSYWGFRGDNVYVCLWVALFPPGSLRSAGAFQRAQWTVVALEPKIRPQRGKRGKFAFRMIKWKLDTMMTFVCVLFRKWLTKIGLKLWNFA